MSAALARRHHLGVDCLLQPLCALPARAEIGRGARDDEPHGQIDEAPLRTPTA